MEQKTQVSCGSVCDRLPFLSAKYPSLVAQNLKDSDGGTEYQIFYTIQNPMMMSHYRCQIPELLGKRIRGCYHGWVILSNHPHNTMWSLWDPLTSKMIRLPPLKLKDGGDSSKSINKQCCLTYPPNDPKSILLLTRTDKPNFVFCRLDNCKRKKLKWAEMSYAKQLKKITGEDDGLVQSLTCCNGKIYALNTDGHFTAFVIHVDININVVNNKDRAEEVVIRLLLFGNCPFPSYNPCPNFDYFLKGGSCTELFFFIVGLDEGTKNTPGAVYLFKLDMTSINWEELEGFKNLDMSNRRWEEMEEEDLLDLEKTRMIWEEMEDLKDAMFFVDLAHDCLVFYSPEIASKLGGFVHIGGETGKIMYSYNVKDRTISVSSMPCVVPTSCHASVWECRLEGDHAKQKDEEQEDDDDDDDDHKEVVKSVTSDEVDFNESNLLDNIPFHVLEMIMEFCVGVEYMNFRATCKLCRLAAPLIQWKNETGLGRLKTYSLVSPWLMVLEDNRGIMSFTDPMSGDKYFMKDIRLLITDGRLCCSMFGWLLFNSNVIQGHVFFNPFTGDVLHQLPPVFHSLESLCFSAPPTSPDCMVVGFTTVEDQQCHVYIHFVAQEPSVWRVILLDFGGARPCSFRFPTFYNGHLYALCNGGELHVFKDLDLGEEGCIWEKKVAKVPISRCCRSPKRYFLTKCDQQHLLLVDVCGEIGESVEVFKLNDSTKEEWEKIDSIGKHMIYICGTTCLCIEAKIQEMENKIYFARLDSKNEKIVFYSLETCTYHTFNGKNIQQGFGNFFGTKHHTTYPHAWIEPSWSLAR